MPCLGRVRSVLAKPTPTNWVEMDRYELGVALGVAPLAELHRQADRRRLASRIPGRPPQVGAKTGRQGRHTSSGDTARPPSPRPLPAVPGQ
jgi:hypothetical protein